MSRLVVVAALALALAGTAAAATPSERVEAARQTAVGIIYALEQPPQTGFLPVRGLGICAMLVYERAVWRALGLAGPGAALNSDDALLCVQRAALWRQARIPQRPVVPGDIHSGGPVARERLIRSASIVGDRVRVVLRTADETITIWTVDAHCLPACERIVSIERRRR